MSKEKPRVPVKRPDFTVHMRRCTSNSIAAFGYSAESSRTLRVKFKKNGFAYDYPGVTANDAAAMEDVNSYGAFVQNHIIPTYGANAYRVELRDGEWDGEERRVICEPYTLAERKLGANAQIEDGRHGIIEIEAHEMTLEDERLLAARIAACLNACVGIPDSEIATVINYGRMICGVIEMRKSAGDDQPPETHARRTLIGVLNQIMALVPESEEALHAGLISIYKSAEFAAPETMRHWWARATAVLNECLAGQRDTPLALNDWRVSVIRLWLEKPAGWPTPDDDANAKEYGIVIRRGEEGAAS